MGRARRGKQTSENPGQVCKVSLPHAAAEWQYGLSQSGAYNKILASSAKLMDCPLIEFAKISSGIAKARDIFAKFYLEKFLTNSSPYVLFIILSSFRGEKSKNVIFNLMSLCLFKIYPLLQKGGEVERELKSLAFEIPKPGFIFCGHQGKVNKEKILLSPPASLLRRVHSN